MLLARGDNPYDAILIGLAVGAVVFLIRTIMLQHQKQRDRMRLRGSGPSGQTAAAPQGNWPAQANTSSASPSAASPAKRAPAKLNLDAGVFKPITDAQATGEARRSPDRSGRIPGSAGAISSRPRPIRAPASSTAPWSGRGSSRRRNWSRFTRSAGRWTRSARTSPSPARRRRRSSRTIARPGSSSSNRRKPKRWRKQIRIEAIARRKATDIVFLGRGVSKGLADRRSHIEKLQAAGLPVLSTPADVAAALKVAIPRLRWLAFHADASPVSHYVRFTVPKRSGGTRLLAAPQPELAATQEWILANILAKVPTHPAAHGFVAGRSTVSNATPHVDRDIVANTDLSDFFPAITFRRVAGLFRELGYSPAVATVLSLLCTDAPRRKVLYAGKPFFVAAGQRALPQGACTSPAISNLVARRLDSRLNGIALKLGWTYTRYADDLSFSASGEPAQRIGYLLARVRHISQDEGFAVNEKKTRVLRQQNRQLVTGVVVNDRPGVDRQTVRRLRAILHRAKKEGLAAQNRERLPHFEAWLSGMIAYIHMVNPKQAAPLRQTFAAVSRA